MRRTRARGNHPPLLCAISCRFNPALPTAANLERAGAAVRQLQLLVSHHLHAEWGHRAGRAG